MDTGRLESEGKVAVDSGLERTRGCCFSLTSDQEGDALLIYHCSPKSLKFLIPHTPSGCIQHDIDTDMPEDMHGT